MSDWIDIAGLFSEWFTVPILIGRAVGRFFKMGLEKGKFGVLVGVGGRLCFLLCEAGFVLVFRPFCWHPLWRLRGAGCAGRHLLFCVCDAMVVFGFPLASAFVCAFAAQ